MKNYLNFLEIGCCIGTGELYQKLTKEYDHDFIFMTSIGDRVPDGVHGFSIDPIKDYLDNLFTPNSVLKLNLAISNKNDLAEIFYVPIEEVIKNSLYSWVVGCASLYQPNDKLLTYLKEKNLLHLLQKDKVPVVKINDLLNFYNIKYIEYFKIDTEGEDYDILLSLFKDEEIVIDKIQFESYIINNKLSQIKNFLKEKNYIELYSGHDSFYIKSDSLPRLLCNPNLLDNIFVQDIGFNLPIKDYQKIK